MATYIVTSRHFGAGGAPNEDANSRIPESMEFNPLTGNIGPSNFPRMFIFNKANNKSLTFDIAGGGSKALRVFMNGNVFESEFNGQGQIRANGKVYEPYQVLRPLAPQPATPDTKESAP